MDDEKLYQNEKSNSKASFGEQSVDRETNLNYSEGFELTNPSKPIQGEIDDENRRKILNKSFKRFGWFSIGVCIVAFIFTSTSTVDSSASAKDALQNKVSTAVSAGTVLLSKDANADPKDYTISHKSVSERTKIWIWDYAAEDGDYVQILVNGTPISDAFMIKHKPKELEISSVAEVQVKGIRDGGGGITYAIRYEANGISYFNGAAVGGGNTYKLVRD